MEPEEILTVPEVAVHVRCSKAHVYKAINGKVPGMTRLPAITIGRRRLVRRSSLDRWIQENEQSMSGDTLAVAHSIDTVDA
jgi:excisionase family DNA binding protein